MTIPKAEIERRLAILDKLIACSRKGSNHYHRYVMRAAELRELLRLAEENEKFRAALRACLELDCFYDDNQLNVQGEILSICHTHGIDPEEL